MRMHSNLTEDLDPSTADVQGRRLRRLTTKTEPARETKAEPRDVRSCERRAKMRWPT